MILSHSGDSIFILIVVPTGKFWRVREPRSSRKYVAILSARKQSATSLSISIRSPDPRSWTTTFHVASCNSIVRAIHWLVKISWCNQSGIFSRHNSIYTFYINIGIVKKKSSPISRWGPHPSYPLWIIFYPWSNRWAIGTADISCSESDTIVTMTPALGCGIIVEKNTDQMNVRRETLHEWL